MARARLFSSWVLPIPECEHVGARAFLATRLDMLFKKQAMLYEKIRPADLTPAEIDYYAEHFFARAVLTRHRLARLPLAVAVLLRHEVVPDIRHFIASSRTFDANLYYAFASRRIENLYFYMTTGDEHWAQNPSEPRL